MNKHHIPLKMRAAMDKEPYYHRCARQDALHDHICEADPLDGVLIDWEHAIIFAGKQVQQRWAIIPSCWWAHRGQGLKKEINVWIALNRATDAELEAHSKAIPLKRERDRLNAIYGVYNEPEGLKPIIHDKPGTIGSKYMERSELNY